MEMQIFTITFLIFILKQLFSKENARSKREFLITHAKESTNNKEFQRKLASYFMREVTTKMVW